MTQRNETDVIFHISTFLFNLQLLNLLHDEIMGNLRLASSSVEVNVNLSLACLRNSTVKSVENTGLLSCLQYLPLWCPLLYTFDVAAAVFVTGEQDFTPDTPATHFQLVVLFFSITYQVILIYPL